jgi:glycine cleavage system aminomethyltransferase T
MALEGFDLTNDFGNAAAEARACRMDCALFDFSFLECVRLDGKCARDVIEAFTGRSLEALAEREICYALRIGPAGEAIADLTVWRTGPDSFEVMSGRREDVADLLACAGPGLGVTNMTADRATFAVQGPGTLEALRRLGDIGPIAPLKYFSFARANLAGVSCTIGRLGYTGEAGFEIIVERAHASGLWNALSAHACPAGFVAADMLRVEAGFILFTNELRLPVWPREARAGKSYQAAAAPKPEITRVSFCADADPLRWPWRPLRDPQRPTTPGTIVVTSACDSVMAGGILGLGYVLATTTATTALHDPTGTFRNVRLTPMPFYDTDKRRPRARWR